MTTKRRDITEQPSPAGAPRRADPCEGPPEVSVVIPAFNEEGPIVACVREVDEAVKGVRRPYEIIVVDDGSTDRTFDLLKDLKKDVPALRVLRFAANCGQTAAFDAGFKAARGQFVVALDADQQNDPADIPRLLELAGEWDVVCGVRAKRRDSLVRRISSRIGNGTRNLLTGDNIRDVGCSLRAFRAECLRDLKLYKGLHRFLPTLLKWEGWSVTEVPVNHRPRQSGRSKYGVWNRMFRGLRDLFAVRWMKSRHICYEIREEIP